MIFVFNDFSIRKQLKIKFQLKYTKQLLIECNYNLKFNGVIIDY